MNLAKGATQAKALVGKDLGKTSWPSGENKKYRIEMGAVKKEHSVRHCKP